MRLTVIAAAEGVGTLVGRGHVRVCRRACVCVPRTVVGRRYMSEQVFYSWHHANAYETASEVVLDVTVYPNPGTMQVVR